MAWLFQPGGAGRLGGDVARARWDRPLVSGTHATHRQAPVGADDQSGAAWLDLRC